MTWYWQVLIISAKSNTSKHLQCRFLLVELCYSFAPKYVFHVSHWIDKDGRYQKHVQLSFVGLVCSFCLLKAMNKLEWIRNLWIPFHRHIHMRPRFVEWNKHNFRNRIKIHHFSFKIIQWLRKGNSYVWDLSPIFHFNSPDKQPII